MKHIVVLMMTLISSSAFAAGTHKCGRLDSIGNLLESKNISERLKVAYVTTEEPAAAPDHILVYVYDQYGGYTCTAISREKDGSGFGYVDMQTLKNVSYDAKKGLLFQIEVSLPNFEDTSKGTRQTLLIRANRATGKVTLE